MDVQLQELVEKIRKDGVDAAEAKAAEIVNAAQAKAAAILSEARAEAESIEKTARADADRLEKAAIASIKQSGRNILISFRDGVVSELSALVASATGSAMSGDSLKELLPTAVKAWIANSGSSDIAVMLSPSDLGKLEATFKAALKGEIEKGLVIGGDDSLSGGFRIGMKDGSSYYDFSAEAVASLFSAYLNPRVAEILKSASKEL